MDRLQGLINACPRLSELLTLVLQDLPQSLSLGPTPLGPSSPSPWTGLSQAWLLQVHCSAGASSSSLFAVTSSSPSTAPHLPVYQTIHSGTLVSWEAGCYVGKNTRLGVWRPGSNVLPVTASCVTFSKPLTLSEPLYPSLKNRDKTCPEGLLGGSYVMMCVKELSKL